MQTLARDIRYAVRQLRRSPVFAATAVITLAIGIGANTAIFTLVHAVLLKSLPVANPAQLYKLGDDYNCCVEGDLQGSWSMFSYPFYLQARDHTDGFEQLAAAQTNRPNLTVRREGTNAAAEPFHGEFVSGNYFATLGVPAFVGRAIAAADDQASAPPVAVASYRVWERYGFDPSLVGKSLTINGMPVTLVGVTPPAFFGDRLEDEPPDFWMPIALEPSFAHENSLLRQTSAGWLYIIGRLRPGTAATAVQAQLTAELRQYLRAPGDMSPNEDPKKIDKQVVPLTPGGGGINAMKDQYEQGLLLLMAVSAAVLIIACANLANLLLARSAANRVRTAVELAMGASRGRIISRYLTESVVLSLLGGAAGLLLALFASRSILLVAFRGATHLPIGTTPSIPVLLFTCAVALATGIVFGVGPAWIASGSDPVDSLRGASRVMGDAVAMPQRVLVVLQAALSVALLTVAILLTTSLRNLDRQPYGFEQQGRLVVAIDPQSAGYTADRLLPLYRRIEDRLSQLPGVIGESLSLYTAQEGNNWGEGVFIPGKSDEFGSSWDRVSTHYFETIGTPIVRGRSFGDQDTADSQKVAIVNEAFARKAFPDNDPIGKHFGKGTVAHAGDYEIVGVAKDAKYMNAARAVRPMYFVPVWQKVAYENPDDERIENASMYMGSIELHVHGDPDAAAGGVRQVLAEIDPNLPPSSLRTFDELIAVRTSEHTLIARLSNAFGLIALLLACVGLYGVTAYRVARRTNEIGIRMALGASRRDISSLVVRGALSQIGVGILIGVPLAFGAARALQSQLFGVSPFNAGSLALAVIVLGGCTLLASVLPARRAAAIEPMRALRIE